MSTDKYFAYVYRSPDNGKILYAGFATDITRVHEIAHNERVSENLGKFEISISGPYRDEIEARNVEAALISAIHPPWNKVAGTGLKFRPFGVPPELVIRRTEPELSVSEIGKITGGAIIVLSQESAVLKHNVQKLTPNLFEDGVVLGNIREYWTIKKYIDEWSGSYDLSPKVLVGVQGPIGSRLIVGSVNIDTAGWLDTPVADHDKNVHRIPTMVDSSLDCYELRGRKTSNVKFGQSSLTWIWVDGNGIVRHGIKSLKSI